jgi:hypothetical protein
MFSQSFYLKVGRHGFHRRSRHVTSQMKFFSGSRGKAALENQRWSFANKQAKRYGSNGLFGIN